MSCNTNFTCKFLLVLYNAFYLPMKLREYQNSIIDEARLFMKSGVRSIVVVSPTGSGKTMLTAYMLKSAANKNMAAFFIVHRRELIKQSIRAFSEVGVPHGVISAGFLEAKKHPIQIASIQTLARRLDRYRVPSLIIWDEAHHQAAGTWDRVYRQFPNAFHIGLTASPIRLDGKGLGKYFKRMIFGPSVRQLIEEGYLSDYKMYAPSNVNLSGVHTRMGDYVSSEVVAIVDRPTITGDAIKHYIQHATGKRALVFAVSIEHSKHIVAQFNQNGIPAEHVDGDTDFMARDLAIKKFEQGDIKILSNVDLFGEGFDLPALECAILLRPTASLGMYLQQVGRALRPFPGKSHAIILDHVGNVQRHGLPCQERQWSLEGYEKPSNGQEPSIKVRVCKSCYAVMRPGGKQCPHCGHAFDVQSRKVDQKEGDLVEVTANEVHFKADQANEMWRCKSMKDLIELGKRRGYRKPQAWAYYKFKFMQQKKLAGVK